MNCKLLITLFAVLVLPVVPAISQISETDRWSGVLETLLSDEELTSYALEELSMLYETLHESPLNINTATREELSQLPFLTDRQIEDIHAYIYYHGPMLTLGELQLTGSLDYNTRMLLREFVYAGEPEEKRRRLSIGEILRYGRNELVAGMDIPLYMRDGFRYHSPQELERYPNRAYRGSRLSHKLRYSFSWHDRIRLGLTADKDAGEPFGGVNKAGYDFISAYFFIRDMGRIRELALGNFKVQFGQGLLMGSGFSLGKSMALTSMSRSAQGLKPHSSTQEYGYLRGVGAAVGWEHTTLTLLAASTPLDATLKGDSLISSFKEDGYHRTALECSKKHNVELQTIAVNVRYSYRGLRYGGTLLAEQLSLPYKDVDRFLGFSADMSVNRARYAFSSELSVLNCKPAIIASMTFRPGGSWTLQSILRHYSPGYMPLHSNAMADGGVGNETGLLTGFTYSGRQLKLNGYADFFLHPESGYSATGRSNGMDLRLEADWRMGQSDRLFATARFKSRQKDCKYTQQLEYCLTGRYRLRWTHTFSSGAEIRTQLHYARYDFIAEPISNGYALTQSYSRSLFKSRLDITLTAAAFYTDSYDSRISVYENGLRYTYNFMTLYGKGGRMALTARYRIGNGMQLSLKAAGTYFLDRDEIGSAQQRIPSCHKEDISLQFTAKF